MAAKSPAQVVVDQHFAEFASQNYPDLPEDEAFELYVADLLLRHRNLNDEQIQSGIVDNSNDGGIDGLFTFLDGALVQTGHPALTAGDPSTKGNGERPSITLNVIQSKNTASWADTPFERLNSNLPTMLDAETSSKTLEKSFHTSVVEQIDIFRTLSKNLRVRFPKILVQIRYVTRSPEANRTEGLATKRKQLETTVTGLLPPDADVSVESFGVETLYKLIAQPPSSTAVLRLRNTILREPGSYLGVATISDYLKFVRDSAGDLRDEFFEANVRDYEGDNTVNIAIQNTLSNDDATEFWWKNNGVTILATQTNAPQQEITMEQPLIVNGLQTTHVLHHVEKAGELTDSRLKEGILVRIIQSADDAVRDQVISGTNRQTRVQSAALFASSTFQHDLERYFLAKGWYYERRKNRYKNLGKPASRRVSIGLLAQAMITLALGEPDAARARPASVLNREGEKVFDESAGPEPYLKAIQLLGRVSTYLKTKAASESLGAYSYSNVRFYVLLGVAMRTVNAKQFESLKFAANARHRKFEVSDDVLADVVKQTKQLFEKWAASHPDATQDSIAKSAEFRAGFTKAINPK
ncbi:AIPR family protein [Microbacterium wangruii]|uniref:AIPR family protein n=1 Tax=Microbacterium wangruii TaxID=3049073 RepID=UPI00256F0331|nr:AIPR family protein [Microbacterium sp. zg-Y1211]MDL5486018.1 AIPR family protein [Microbacterium sp. zg-Y1211]